MKFKSECKSTYTQWDGQLIFFFLSTSFDPLVTDAR